ncbi:MAG: 2-oxoacid:acceptor oxidoreductase subunit alpha [Pseudomonadota bacterium]
MDISTALSGAGSKRHRIESAVVRFAGDSGDGMQLTGGQFTLATALSGNNLATFPDFPAEIRAPTGTTFGVSAFQINFGAREIKTSGDAMDVLVAMNPAALKVNLSDVKLGGLLILDSGAFGEKACLKAGYQSNPMEDASLAGFRVLPIDMTKLTLEAVKSQGLNKKDGLRCKNMWALGLVFWLFERERAPSIQWLEKKFAERPELAAANVAALNAGHAYGETVEISDEIARLEVPPAEIEPGLYRNITGSEAVALGLLTGARLAELELMFCSYPITPASQVLHHLAKHRKYGATTFQAEDEISAICAAIGASYAGALGVTSSSGPGIALKGEALGLAVAVELPLVVINSQRAGPSTGMPTKTEQSDLFQALYGRNADSPLVVLAASSPGDCYLAAIAAVRLAVKYMTPVILLSDGYIANASEPWRLPDVDDLAPIEVNEPPEAADFAPYRRDAETLARPWAVPGMPGLEHRIGGLEKADGSGHVSYDPANHQRMTELRAAKIAGIAKDIPDQEVTLGPERGPLAVVGWGSTFGPISRAVSNLNEKGVPVAHIHLRHLSPFPANLGELLGRYDRILVPEMNSGQLVTVLRSTYLVPAEGLSKVAGRPFKIAEIEEAIESRLTPPQNSGEAA